MATEKLMKASLWGQREFERESVPDNRTIKRWVKDGLLRGKIVDGSAWVSTSEKWGVDSLVAQRVHELIKD